MCGRDSTKTKSNIPDLPWGVLCRLEDPPGHLILVVAPRRSHAGSPSSRCDNLARLPISEPQAHTPTSTRVQVYEPHANLVEPQTYPSVPQATIAAGSSSRLPYVSTPYAKDHSNTEPQATLTKPYRPKCIVLQAYVLFQAILQVGPPPPPRMPQAPDDSPHTVPLFTKRLAVRSIITTDRHRANRENKHFAADLPGGGLASYRAPPWSPRPCRCSKEAVLWRPQLQVRPPRTAPHTQCAARLGFAIRHHPPQHAAGRPRCWSHGLHLPKAPPQASHPPDGVRQASVPLWFEPPLPHSVPQALEHVLLPTGTYPPPTSQQLWPTSPPPVAAPTRKITLPSPPLSYYSS